MKFSTSRKRLSSLPGAAVVAALMTVGTAASALPQFTFNPAAVGLAGTAITADNILVSSFTSVTIDGAGNFSQTGYLPISGFQLGGSTFSPAGLNSSYGMYVAFTGTGTTTVNNPATAYNFGDFSSLTYTLFGYNGTATFDFAGNVATETATGEVALASGTLIAGRVVTIPVPGGGFSPIASATMTLSLDSPTFFSSPDPFYTMAMTAFTSTPSQVEPFAGGFRIRQGGGTLNFAPVPEPSSIALMLGGLGAVGFLYRRRQGKQA